MSFNNQEGQKRLRGIGVSEGIALGAIMIVERERIYVPYTNLADEEIEPELKRLETALEKARQGLEEIKKGVLQADSHEPAFIIDAHMMMLDDDLLVQGAIDLIKERKINAEWALRNKMTELSSAFAKMSDPYLRERGKDIQEVVERVIREAVEKVSNSMLEKSSILRNKSRRKSRATPAAIRAENRPPITVLIAATSATSNICSPALTM